MVEFSKRLKIKNTRGEITSCTLYTTLLEANVMGGALSLRVDGTQCWAALGSTHADTATSGRVKKRDGRILAILRHGSVTPGSVTVSGQGTFTVPLGVNVLQLNNRRYAYVRVTGGQTYEYKSFWLSLGVLIAIPWARFGAYETFDRNKSKKTRVTDLPVDITLSWSDEINKHAVDGTA